MKKKFMLAMAIVMLLGSVKAMAEEMDEFDHAHQLAIINTVQLNKIEDNIKLMEGLKDLADLQYQEGETSTVGQITKLTEEATILAKDLNADSDGLKVDETLEQVKILARTACSIAKVDQQDCKIQE
ncbi:hypothetical protein [Bdellovibrio reynosensis]|uniref:Uncharacterized protein n=1 Tax=Bdellovibrio reynosensis TaxID=2835041 RepID=A0ABY4C575_9BACT|nr:hypothetical protein [Bdellovibrio reynosensis]UOF00018.1 hypothetical protein MNR06_09925 [Bdellovibrio reynosensis]